MGARSVFGEIAQTQIAVIVIFDVIGIELPTVHRRLIVPVNALADVPDERCVVGH